MRNYLNRVSKVLTLSLALDDVLIHPACGEVVPLQHRTGRKALVVTEVEIRLRTVIGHKDLTVLVGAHRSRINVDVGIHLEVGDPKASGFEQRTHGCT